MKIKVITEVYDLGMGLDESPLKGKEFEAICNKDKTVFWIFHEESPFKLQGKDVVVLPEDNASLADVINMGGKDLKAIELKFR